MNKKILLKVIFAIIVTPGVIWLIIHFKNVLTEWSKIPHNLKNNISTLVSADKTAKVDEIRWNSFGSAGEKKISKVFYNKGLVLVEDFFSLTTYYSPRLYFQSGDGTELTPSTVEPIAIPLFFFWVLGIVTLVRRNKFKLLLSALGFGFLAFLIGQKNFAFLFPIMITYLIISIEGIETIKNKKIKKGVYIFLVIYGLYLLGRLFLLK